MAGNAVAFDRDAAERIAAVVRRVEDSPLNPKAVTQRPRNLSGNDARQFSFGVTATNSQFPDYPTIYADTYVVRRQEWFFDEVPGLQEVTRLNRSETVVAHRALEDDDTNDILPEGTAVILWQVPTRKGTRYWFYAIAPPNSSSSSESSSEESSSESSEESSSEESSSSSSSSAGPCDGFGTCTATWNAGYSNPACGGYFGEWVVSLAESDCFFNQYDCCCPTSHYCLSDWCAHRVSGSYHGEVRIFACTKNTTHP